MRIVGGAWRGRRLVAPAGTTTRPTSERLRQALFDMLLHAPWGGRAAIDGACVLDLFAGSGALGLEALSRGAAHCTFLETDRTARAALSANIAACGAEARARCLAQDATRPPAGPPAGLVFIDPPYASNLAEAALRGLLGAGRIDENSLIVCETGADAPAPPLDELLAERVHGAGRISIGRSFVSASTPGDERLDCR